MRNLIFTLLPIHAPVASAYRAYRSEQHSPIGAWGVITLHSGDNDFGFGGKIAFSFNRTSNPK